MAGKGNLHKRLILRLVLAGLALALGLGALVLVYDIEKVDEQLVDLATREADGLIRRALPHLPPAEAADRQAIEGILSRFVAARRSVPGGHFVFAEVYGPDRQKVAEVIEPAKEHVEHEMDKGVHKFPATDRVWYRKILLEEALYLQAMVRLEVPGRGTVGYFEGVYQVSDAVLEGIKETVATTVGLVVLSVLLTTGVLYPVIMTLNRDVIDRSEALLKANINTLEALGDAIAKRDSDTNVHNYRVTIYAIRLAEAARLDNDTIRALIKGAFLHDVGKIAIPDSILLKPGKLDDDEFAVMKTHVEHGLDIVSRSTWLADAAAVVRSHHEKYDGTGYMQGLKGADIPLTARVFAIVDVFDALTSRRPYKEPMSLDRTLEILREGRGTHFDPALLDTFLTLSADLYDRYAGRDDDGVEADLRTLTDTYFHRFAG